MDNGVFSTNLDTVAVADQIMVNRGGSTAVQPINDLATQLAGSGAIATALTNLTQQAAKDHVPFTTATDMNANLGYAADTEARVYGSGAGVYKKVGAANSGSWSYVGALPGTDYTAPIAQLAPILAGVYDDMRPSLVLANGAVQQAPFTTADIVNDSRVRGVAIPLGVTGQNTLIIADIPIDPNTSTDLQGRQLRLIAGYKQSAPFTRTPVPLVDAIKTDGTISSVAITIVGTVGDFGRPVFTLDFIIPANTATIRMTMKLTSAVTVTNAGGEAVALSDLSLAVKATTADASNTAGENSDTTRRTTVLASTEDVGSIVDELIVTGQMASGAQYRMASDNFTIVGWTLPDGVTGQGTLIQSIYGLSDRQTILLGGATIEWTFVLEHSSGYSHTLEASLGVDGSQVQSMMTRNQRVDDTHTVLSVQAVMPSSPKFIAAVFRSTGTTAAVGTEWVQLSDVAMKVVRSPDRARSGPATSAHIASQRNKEKALTAIEAATRPEEIRPVHVIVDVPSTATVIAPLITAYPQGLKSRRRQFKLASGTYLQSGIFPKPYDGMIGNGEGRTIVDGSLPASSSLASIEATSTIESYYDADYSDMTVIAKNMRYAMHSDLGRGFQVENVVQRLRGMVLIHRGNQEAIDYQTSTGGNPGGVWANPCAWGAGSWSGWDLSAEDSVFIGVTAAVIFHNNLAFSKPSKMSLKSCRLVATATGGYAMRIYNFGSQKKSRVDLVGNVLSGDLNYFTYAWFQDTLDYQPADHSEHLIVGHSNTPAVFTVQDFGRALKIESAATSGTSTIVVSGNAVAAIFGPVVSKPGAGGIKGYVYGAYDVSGTAVGVNADKLITALGKRLGDCSSVNKVLTIQINGASSVNVVFNADYTNASNATILATINAALGASATASLYAIGERFRPMFTDEEKSLRNASGEGILMGMACAYVSDGSKSIRKMLSTDPITVFAGVAWEDIYPGSHGRVKSAGFLPIADLLRSDATVLALGTGLSVDPAAPGYFKTVDANVVIKAIRPDAVAVVDGLKAVPITGSAVAGPAGANGLGIPTTGMATGRLMRFGATEAEWADAAQVRSDLGIGSIASQAANAVAISGGTISGTSIGGAVPAAVKATSMQADTVTVGGGTIDGTAIGGTTPASVKATTLQAATATISGGTLDNTAIGGTTPASVKATTLQATTATISGGTVDGTAIGGTTASTVKATTLQTSGNVGVGRAPPSNVAGYSIVGVDGASGTFISQYINGTEATRIQVDSAMSLTSIGTRPIVLKTNNAEVARFDTSGNIGMGAAADIVITSARHFQLRSYTVSTLPSAAGAAQWIYVTNESGGATPAFSDGTNWRRVADRAIVS